MKLVGFTVPGENAVLVGRLDGDHIAPITDVKAFWDDPLPWVANARNETDSRRHVGTVELVPPVPESARVICIGLNYRAHAAEGSFTVPDYPTLFGRWTSSLTAGGQSAPVPAGEAGLDWEGEVAAYVGASLCDVDADTAREAVLGYSTFNDLTARKAQKLTAQWTLGKNGDRSGPMGPLVTSDEVGDLRDGLRVLTRVNGTVVQDGNTRDHIFELGEVLALISRTFTLNPGDVIATGTPEGVGYVRNPPWLLNAGDVVEVEVDRLGTLVTPIVDSSGRSTPSA
ncbi:fumarylacetoacetate hydrolase [Rhodococcoides trifolii]|uniref:Fumarylacetoacetate hydrolase n=1 Tax=Rhodococcoides trifolii TaxID=908250 RepID=A0A917G7F6_9NOCA|nr:fumarylacetoacetate hydrolase family protein [Rhodococcus trifolii]GGG26528.1 fumarylacetoacetate hydrolase [Rhodococcus trifolii]